MGKRFAVLRNGEALLRDRRGNFGLMTGLLLPILLGTAGAGMEATRVMQVKQEMQAALDSATLAAATAARVEEGKRSNKDYADEVNRRMAAYTGELSKGKDGATGSDSDQGKKKPDLDTIAERSDSKRGMSFKISATLNAEIPLAPLISFIGIRTVKVGVSSTAQSAFSKGAALSLYLVLDRSGSMSFKTDTVDNSKNACPNYTEKSWPKVAFTSPCYVTKIQSLKEAVSYLTDTLNKADPSYQDRGSPESELVRTGAIAYNSAPFPPRNLSWGTSQAGSYVNAIDKYPQGGTDASLALKTAFAALRSDNSYEKQQHADKGSDTFQRYIVLMTDGEMTSSAIDSQVRSTCSAVKADGIQIFTVAFMAPAKGKSLLQYCASSPDNYYDPENMEEIVAAFGEIARKAASTPTRLMN
ncbi:TadE/TadG family type IV pilus assembly protein [uncultured Agrobacterium sp.]|uniref:vWA domain-containing protein n=1 Tax=uncultured Agrobacterium sp. TaxID=157277 RepID=UPI0025DDF60B|nr:TadE/TadG family type IV pilus assembly protein [uncultured Agrobacterium sp.]